MTESNEGTETGLETELVAWLKENWDPESTVAEWWERLGTAGWAAPSWPAKWYGQDMSPSEAVRAQQIIAEFGALGAPGGLGLLLAGPTIAVQGTDEQRDRYLRDIVTGQKAWCQLFSEPGAGSDLAGLSTSAVRDGDQWIVNGQKVWTSTGTTADLGMLLARTDPDVPKHQGITYFAVDMHQPGVEVRPLRQITGTAEFNEVFFTDARTPADWIVGARGEGWAVANTTLKHERGGVGGVDTIDRLFAGLVKLAQRSTVGGRPAIEDPTVHRRLVELEGWLEVHRYCSYFQLSRSINGEKAGRVALMNKLSATNFGQRVAALALDLLGDRSLLAPTGGTAGERPGDEKWMAQYLGSLALAIAGGTSNIQRNIIAERGLELPRDPLMARTQP